MIPQAWQQYFAHQQQERTQHQQVRKLRNMRHMGGMRVQVGSRELVNFSSNDYLGLAGDLRIAEAAASAAGRYGWGTGASRLVCGTSMLHQKLETELARFRGTEAALVFGSGYVANLGVLSALLDKGDVVLSDAMNHASIVAGCKLSGAEVRIFDHRNYDDLERRIATAAGRKKLVVTDSLFSIDGDLAEIPRLLKICDRNGALLVVDDAHANGCMGKKGRGVAEMQAVATQVPVTVGTFSKALGSYGGFVACSEQVREHLVNHSRPFIYTTSLPVALAAANIEALRIVREEGETLRQKLAQQTRLLRTKLEAADFKLTGHHHIIGLRVGDSDRALFMGEEMERQGLLVYPMRWPTVPHGHDTLRMSVSAAHTDDDLYRLVQALKIARDHCAGRTTTAVSKREAKRPTHQSLDAADLADLMEAGDAGAPAPESNLFDDHGDLSAPISAVDSARHSTASSGSGEMLAVSTPGPGDTMIPSGPASAAPAPAEQAAAAVPALPAPSADATAQPIVVAPAPVEAVAATLLSAAAEVAPEPAPPAPEAAPTAPAPAVATPAEVPVSGLDSPAGTSPAVSASETSPAGGPAAPVTPVVELTATVLDADDDGDETQHRGGSGDTLAPEHVELADPVIADIEGGTRRRDKKAKRRTRALTRTIKKQRHG